MERYRAWAAAYQCITAQVRALVLGSRTARERRAVRRQLDAFTSTSRELLADWRAASDRAPLASLLLWEAAAVVMEHAVRNAGLFAAGLRS